jgi:3-oxoacyl-[acyl-carrier-protein] synthase II
MAGTASRRVVITGVGVAAPIGLGREAFWQGLLEGRCGIRRIEAFDPEAFPSQVGGLLPEFKFADCVPKSYRKAAKVMADDIKIAVYCAYEAVRDAGLITKCILERGEADGAAEPSVTSQRFGANIGAGLICADLRELAGALARSRGEDGVFSYAHWGAEGMQGLTPLWLLKFLPNMLACHVTIVHDAQGPSNTITCGEASSHLAVAEAFRTLARGDADVCICGGAESKVNPMALARPILLDRVTTEGNDEPESAVQPFGMDRSGYAVAEGGGLLILEELEHARARGARIYAELAGVGAATNTSSWSDPDPSGAPTAQAIQAALRDAEASPEEVDLIVTVGAGSKKDDASEAAAWHSVFGDRLSDIPAIANKGALGNNGAGSGALDLATQVLAVHHGVVPPSVNTRSLDPDCHLRFVQREPLSRPVRLAVSAAYALSGGQQGALVLRKFEE